MARLVAVRQQTLPSLFPLPSTLSGFNGTKPTLTFSNQLILGVVLICFLVSEYFAVQKEDMAWYMHCLSAEVYHKSDLLLHAEDLARAFVQVLDNEKASQQVFNILGGKYVTFDGLARTCAKVVGFPEPEIVRYNSREFDFGKKKAFLFRHQHFFAWIEKARAMCLDGNQNLTGRKVWQISPPTT